MNAKLRNYNLGLGVNGALTTCPTAARAGLGATASVTIRATTEFHVPLAPYGTGTEAGSRGRCWLSPSRRTLARWSGKALRNTKAGNRIKIVQGFVRAD